MSDFDSIDSFLAAVMSKKYFDEIKERLIDVVLSPISTAAAKAAVEAAEIAFSMGLGIDWNLVNNAAIYTASIYTYDFVSRMTESMQAHLAMAITDSVALGEPLSALIDRVADVFGRSRAEAIGITETTRIFSQANVEYWKRTRMLSKVWVTANDELVCDICGPQDQKVIPIDETGFNGVFSGVKVDVPYPPAHVRCRCYLLPSTENLNPEPQAPERELTQGEQIAQEYLKRIEEQEWEDMQGFSSNDTEFLRFRHEMLEYSRANFEKDLLMKQKNMVNSYTGHMADVLNDSLRGVKYAHSVNELSGDIALLDAALKAGKAFPENLVVYRGIGGTFGEKLAQKAFRFKPGDKIADKGYMSTTILPDITANFSNGVQYKIFVEAGSVGRYIETMSQVKNECEFLLPRGLKLTVLKVEQTSQGPLIWLYLPKASTAIKAERMNGGEEMPSFKLSEPNAEEPREFMKNIYEKLDSGAGFSIEIDGKEIEMEDFLRVVDYVEEEVSHNEPNLN